VQLLEVARGQHPGVRDDDHVGEPVTSLKLLHDRDDGGGLGLVSLKAADLEGEPDVMSDRPVPQ